MLRGYSDCAVIDGHLVFTGYTGKADNVVVRSTSRTYDYDREKYPFTIRITVPPAAAPGTAKVYAEPFCGPPEEYPASAARPFRVERSPLSLQVSPRRPDGGDLLRIRAGTCAGPTGRLTVRLRDGDRVTDREVGVAEDGSAAVSVRAAAGGGRLEVSLPQAAAQCRGSSYAGPVSVLVRAAAGRSAPPEPQVSPSASRASDPPVASAPAATPSESATPVAATPARTHRGGGRSAGLVATAALVLAAGGVGAIALGRRVRRG